MEKLIADQWAVLGEFDREHKVKLVIDEWGCWHPAGTEINREHLFEQMGCLRDALVAALTLDTFNRHADKVDMANIAQLVNNLHSLFLADGDRFVATPTFHVFEMYKAHHGARAVKIDVQTPEVAFRAGGQERKLFRVAGISVGEGKSGDADAGAYACPRAGRDCHSAARWQGRHRAADGTDAREAERTQYVRESQRGDAEIE